MYQPYPARVYPPLARIVAAFFVAPAAAALLMTIATALRSGMPLFSLQSQNLLLLTLTFGAYPIALILGVPAYLGLRRHFDPTIVNCGLAGAVISMLPWAFLVLLGPPAREYRIGGRATVIDGEYTSFGWLVQLQGLVEIGFFGLIGGMVFWLVAAANSRAGKINSETIP